MGFFELIMTAIGLSMDAFAVSLSKGLALRKWNWRSAIIVGVFFGGFQAGMPILGYFFGVQLSGFVVTIGKWIAVALLACIGINMLWESRNETEKCSADLGMKVMLSMAVATSIDALAVGVSFAFLDVNIWFAALIIGAATFIISVAGVKLGTVFGEKYCSKAEIAGGIILILIGLKIALETLGVIRF